MCVQEVLFPLSALQLGKIEFTSKKELQEIGIVEARLVMSKQF